MTTAKASLFRTLMVLAAAALAASLLTLIAAGEPVQAGPGTTGKIAFASDRAGNLDIWVMNADGTNPVQMTTDPLLERSPSWSPDGRKIVFTRGERAGSEIFVMNADGTGQPQQLTFNMVGEGSPTWSPDGTKITYTRRDTFTNSEVYVMDADGTGVRNLTNDPAFDFEPDWSPNGKRIAFTSDRSGGDVRFEASAVHTMRPDGTQLRKLTDDNLEAFSPAWSPTGDKLAFSDHLLHGESDLFVMEANGKGVTQLCVKDATELCGTPENDTGATWAPDGGKIAFELFVLDSQGAVVPESGEIYAIGADGGPLTNLTDNPNSVDETPDWSPT